MNETELVFSDLTLHDRFYNKVFKASCNCWIWLASLRNNTYGHINVKGKLISSHRVSAIWAGMDIEGKQVLHRCDIPTCVNPDHLFVGTQQDNINDMMKKGRHRKTYVLTEEQVREIRSLEKTVPKTGGNGGGNCGEIARIMKLSKQTVWRVLTGQTYSEIANG